MSRCIKFRFWCPYTKKMKNPTTLYQLEWGRRFIPSQCFDHAMQFIGIKDEDGEEVFEGDILMMGEVAAVVKWDEFNAGFMLEESYMHDIDNVEYLKVIGNIYENPELLEN